MKTILLVFSFLHLIPQIEGKKLSDYIFGFEELENNLHPALQRRLFLYLRDIAINQQCKMFITTHSNVVIDLFSNDDDAQIIHVYHNGENATAARTRTYLEHRGILDDLDVRASDLLQANGIVWVEGPSDRLYFNRWIQLWTDGQLREGGHYQCVFYGGRLLAHLSAKDPEINIDDLVSIRVNRNAILLIDSDRRKKGTHVNTTKRRLVSEIEAVEGFPWISAGKEIENYIPCEALQKYYGFKLTEPLGQYESLDVYLDKLKTGEGKRFLQNKVMFAEKISPFLSK